MNRKARNYLRTCLIIILLFLVPSTFFPSVEAEPSRLFDLNFKNADIKDVLRTLADYAGVSFIIDNEVTGIVTVYLVQVSFTDALSIIAKNNGLTYTKENRVYRISKIDNSFIKVEYEDGLLSVEAREAKLGTLLETISQKTGVNLVPAPDLQESISINLIKTPLTDGIKAVLRQGNCTEEIIGKISYIRKSKSANFPISYQNQKLTLDAQNIPLPALTRAITEKTGISVVSEQNLTTPINIYFQDLSLEEALTVICETHGLQLIREDQSWRIVKKSGAFRVKVKDNLLTVDADGVDLGQVLNEISRQSGISIMVAKDVRETVTAHFQNLPLLQGLNVMLEPRNLILEKHRNYYYVLANKTQNPNIRISYDPETEFYDLEVQSAPLAAILNEMARRADINIVILPQVNWTVNNIRIRDQKFDQIMDLLLRGTIFTYMISDGTYIVGDGLMIRPENREFAVVKIYPIKYLKVEQLFNTLPPVFPRANFVQIQEKNAIIVTAPPQIHKLFEDYLAQIDVPGIDDHTEVIKIKYLKAEDVLKLIPPSIPKNDLIVIKESNAIAATGPQNYLNQVKQYIEKIDQINPMIVFDIKVISFTLSKNTAWESPASSLKGLTALQGVESDTVLKQLEASIKQNKGKILQNPTISTLNGYPTKFQVSTKRSFTVAATKDEEGNTTSTKTVNFDTGLFFTITPWVSANNQITMEIKPTISEYYTPDQPDMLGKTNERTTETTIRVNDSETVIISGLRSATVSKQKNKIPLLGDIPILGYLFQYSSIEENEEEFVIVITPHLIYDSTDKANLDQEHLRQYSTDFKNESHLKKTTE